jgi:hypothetical protein
MLKQLEAQARDVLEYLERMDLASWDSSTVHAWNMAHREVADMRTKIWQLLKLLGREE